MNIKDIEIEVFKNPFTYGVFNYHDINILIAPSAPEFIIAEDEAVFEAEDGQLFITEG
jgi:hypothetical protein